MIFRFQLVENLLEKDYKMSKKYLYYVLTFIVSISILGVFSYSFRYQWFIKSIVDRIPLYLYLWRLWNFNS